MKLIKVIEKGVRKSTRKKKLGKNLKENVEKEKLKIECSKTQEKIPEEIVLKKPTPTGTRKPKTDTENPKTDRLHRPGKKRQENEKKCISLKKNEQNFQTNQ